LSTAAGTPALSVVIPARDAGDTIRDQLHALTAQTWDEAWEIVVVDNGSTDATAAIVEGLAARDGRIRLVPAGGGTGVAHSRNVGIEAARAPAIAMCDADDVVDAGWVAAMGRALREHELVTGPLDVESLNPAWVTGTRGRALGDGPGDFGGIAFAHSCNVGFRREVVERCGGFDESLAAGEDVEWSARAARHGVSLHFAPEARVRYRYRTTLGGLFHQARSYGRANRTLLLRLRAAGTAPDVGPAWRNWAWLARHVGIVASRPGRARWVWVAGGRVGDLEGRLRRDRGER
jgi:GT2 family glycosyltransferase